MSITCDFYVKPKIRTERTLWTSTYGEEFSQLHREFNVEYVVRQPSYEEQFQKYSEDWKNETGHLSTMYQKINNENFFKIISIGKPAIELILKDLQKQSTRFWFFALECLVNVHMNENGIVSSEEKGNVANARHAWLNWGVKKNIIK